MTRKVYKPAFLGNKLLHHGQCADQGPLQLGLHHQRAGNATRATGSA